MVESKGCELGDTKAWMTVASTGTLLGPETDTTKAVEMEYLKAATKGAQWVVLKGVKLVSLKVNSWVDLLGDQKDGMSVVCLGEMKEYKKAVVMEWSWGEKKVVLKVGPTVLQMVDMMVALMDCAKAAKTAPLSVANSVR